MEYQPRELYIMNSIFILYVMNSIFILYVLRHLYHLYPNTALTDICGNIL